MGILVERLGDGARDAVLQALNDPDELVRAEVLQAALDEGLTLPTDLLTNLFFNDPSAQVRFLALEGLRDDPNAREFAERALKDPDQHVQDLAREILAGLDEATRPRPPGAAAADEAKMRRVSLYWEFAGVIPPRRRKP